MEGDVLLIVVVGRLRATNSTSRCRHGICRVAALSSMSRTRVESISGPLRLDFDASFLSKKDIFFWREMPPKHHSSLKLCHGPTIPEQLVLVLNPSFFRRWSSIDTATPRIHTYIIYNLNWQLLRRFRLFSFDGENLSLPTPTVVYGISVNFSYEAGMNRGPWTPGTDFDSDKLGEYAAQPSLNPNASQFGNNYF